MSDRIIEHEGRRYRVTTILDGDGGTKKWADGSDVLSVFDEETGELALGLTMMHNPFSFKKLGESMRQALDRLSQRIKEQPEVPVNLDGGRHRRGANQK